MNDSITQIYRQVEPTLKKRARSFARKWTGADSEDLGGAGREAFVKALRTYNPEYGTSMSTWIVNCANQQMKDECTKIALSRKRFDQLPELENMERGQLDYGIVQMEIESDAGVLSFDAKSLLKARLCGYNNYDLTRRKFISRWKLEKAEKELVAFGEQYVGI